MAKIKAKSLLSRILKCAWCSYIYFIWQERNVRFYAGNASFVTHIVENIRFVVKNRISYMNHVSRDIVNVTLQENWGLLDSIFVYVSVFDWSFLCIDCCRLVSA